MPLWSLLFSQKALLDGVDVIRKRTLTSCSLQSTWRCHLTERGIKHTSCSFHFFGVWWGSVQTQTKWPAVYADVDLCVCSISRSFKGAFVFALVYIGNATSIKCYQIPWTAATSFHLKTHRSVEEWTIFLQTPDTQMKLSQVIVVNLLGIHEPASRKWLLSFIICHTERTWPLHSASTKRQQGKAAAFWYQLHFCKSSLHPWTHPDRVVVGESFAINNQNAAWSGSAASGPWPIMQCTCLRCKSTVVRDVPCTVATDYLFPLLWHTSVNHNLRLYRGFLTQLRPQGLVSCVQNDLPKQYVCIDIEIASSQDQLTK